MTKFYEVTVDPNELSKLFADLPTVTKVATARTLDIVARKVNKNLKAHVAFRYNVPKGSMKVGGVIFFKRANAKAGIGKSIIVIKRRGRGLIKYGAKQLKAGLSVRVRKTRKLIKGGFIAPMRKNGVDKFAFIKGTGKKAGKITRLTKKGTPYSADKRAVLQGPTIADLYTNESAEKVLLNTIDDEFQKNLDIQFNNQFEKKRRR